MHGHRYDNPGNMDLRFPNMASRDNIASNIPQQTDNYDRISRLTPCLIMLRSGTVVFARRMYFMLLYKLQHPVSLYCNTLIYYASKVTGISPHNEHSPIFPIIPKSECLTDSWVDL